MRRINDGHVEAGLHRVPQEDAVEDAARARSHAETDVADAQRSQHAGDALLDEAQALDGLDGAVTQFGLAGGQREGERVENEVFRAHAVVFAGDLRDALRDGQLAFAVVGHALFVDGHGEHAGAVFPGDRQDLVDALAPVLEIVAVDDGAARVLLQRGGGDAGLGGVDDQRGGHRQRQLLDQLLHLLQFVVALGQGDADVQHVGAALHLVDGDLHHAVVIVGQQQLLDLATAQAADALADHGGAGPLHHGRGGHGAGGLRLVLRLTRGRWSQAQRAAIARVAVHPGDQLRHVFRGGAAAAADHVDAARGKLRHHLTERAGFHRIDGLALDIDGQAGVGQHAERQAAVFQQVLHGGAHVLGAS